MIHAKVFCPPFYHQALVFMYELGAACWDNCQATPLSSLSNPFQVLSTLFAKPFFHYYLFASDCYIALVIRVFLQTSRFGFGTLHLLPLCSMLVDHNSHRPGRPREINFMSRYICFSQNGPFDVSFEELFSKAKNPGGFFRKNVF